MITKSKIVRVRFYYSVPIRPIKLLKTAAKKVTVTINQNKIANCQPDCFT
jgi:hypothetical protein